MNKDLYLFREVRPSTLVEEAMRFDPNSLETLSTETVSKYLIALGQYLIYFKSELNKTKGELVVKKKLYTTSLSLVLTSKVVKKHGTKTAATEYLVSTVPCLSELDEAISYLNQELTYLDGMDKPINEYINTFKRELSRREQELFTIRSERRA